MGLFEADPVAGDYGLVESEPGLRAVPVDEFTDGMIVRALGTPGREAVKDCRFRLFEIRQFQNGFRGCVCVCSLPSPQILSGSEDSGGRDAVYPDAGAFMGSLGSYDAVMAGFAGGKVWVLRNHRSREQKVERR